MRYERWICAIGCSVIAGIVLWAGHLHFAQKTTEVLKQPHELTVIPIIFLCDEATQNKSNAELVEEFNTIYKGKYYLDVEWFTGNAADYRARIKMLNSVDELPAIITDVGFDPAFFKLLIENQQIINFIQCDGHFLINGAVIMLWCTYGDMVCACDDYFKTLVGVFL